MDKEQLAIARLQDAARLSEHRYKKPLMVTYSGGKDSQVLVALAERAGINFEVVNSHTTADAPETVYFIREQFKAMEERGIKCSIVMPRYKDKPVSMWTLIPQKLMPPTRLVRYCCDVLKENTGRGRFIATGVRWAESARRKNSRGVMELMHKDPAKRIILIHHCKGVTNGQRTLLSDEDDQQSAWSVRMRERKVRLVETVGQLLFRLVDCTEIGQHRNKDEEVRT